MATLALPVNIIYTLACAFVSLIVLFLNPVIISVIYNDHQLRRQPSIIYIVNLALVDLCFAAVTFTTTLFRFLHLTTIFPLCLVLHLYLPLCLITASLLLMFTNSVDRFIFIRMSLKYHSIMNSRIAKRVAIAIWTYSLAFPLLPNVVFDHFWKYDKCADITATQTYRYLHIPLQATFFITIVFTVLMFVSVFRVVKNSRRLRHIPTRSSSMDSLSTTLSSPTLNASTPSLPPISELIPYEHGQGHDCNTSPTARPCVGSDVHEQSQHSNTSPTARPCVGSDVHEQSQHSNTSPTARPCVGSDSRRASLAASRQCCLPKTREALSTNLCLPDNRDAMLEHTSLHPENILPDLIISQLLVADAIENGKKNIDKAAGDAINESISPEMLSDLRNKEHFQVVDTASNTSASRISSITPDVVTISSEVLTKSADMAMESHDELCSLCSRSSDADKQDRERGVFQGRDTLNSDIFPVAITPEEMRSSNVCGSANLARGGESAVSDVNKKQSRYSLQQAVAGRWSLSKPTRKHEHSIKWNQKHIKGQLHANNYTFFKSHGYTIRSANWPHRYRFKMKSTIPREPLQMLNFRLEKCSSNDLISNSHLQEDETCFSDTVITTQMSVRRRLSTTRRQATNILTGTHNFAVLPSLRARRRSLSTSDNSSTMSIESSSSLSHVTTESTVTNEGMASNLQRMNSGNMQADVTRPDLRATLVQRKVIGSFSDPGTDSRRNIMTASGVDVPQRSRVLSVRADIRVSTRRPPRLRSLSSNSHSNSVDSPRLPLRRAYSRSISTLTTSSTSSIPFGAFSYSGRDIRTLKILFIMFCVYIMLWLPAFVIQIFRYFNYDVSIEITLIVHTLGISNSVFNFFVYPMRIPKLRVSFKKLFKSAIADMKKSTNRCMSVIKGR